MAKDSGLGPMAILVSIVTGIVVLIALYSFIPTIGGTIENAQPTLAADSNWNITNNADLPTGVDLWEDNAPLIGLVILAMLIAIAIAYFRGIGGR